MGHLEAYRVSWPGPLIVAPGSTAENTDIQAVECCLLYLFVCLSRLSTVSWKFSACSFSTQVLSIHNHAKQYKMCDSTDGECENLLCSLPSPFVASTLTHAYAALHAPVPRVK